MKLGEPELGRIAADLQDTSPLLVLSASPWGSPEEFLEKQGWRSGPYDTFPIAAEEAAEKPSNTVILSGAKDLALCLYKAMRDSSSPAAPQNDSAYGFFRSL